MHFFHSLFQYRMNMKMSFQALCEKLIAELKKKQQSIFSDWYFVHHALFILMKQYFLFNFFFLSFYFSNDNRNIHFLKKKNTSSILSLCFTRRSSRTSSILHTPQHHNLINIITNNIVDNTINITTASSISSITPSLPPQLPVLPAVLIADLVHSPHGVSDPPVDVLVGVAAVSGGTTAKRAVQALIDIATTNGIG